jgi:ribosomal protein L25 (general stress protein Ctc)
MSGKLVALFSKKKSTGDLTDSNVQEKETKPSSFRKSFSAPLSSFRKEDTSIPKSLDEQFDSELKTARRKSTSSKRLSIKNVESLFSTTNRTSNGKSTMKEVAREQEMIPEIFYSNFDYNFEEAMKNKKLKKVFATFLQESHNDELFLCMEEIEKFSSIKSAKERYKKAMDIFSRFIVPYAEQEINISNETRKEITQSMDSCSASECPADLFQHVEKIVNLSLQVDCFMRFVQDKSFRNFCDTLEQEVFSAFSTLILLEKKK